mgnify:CR=1 FL=1
MAYLTTVRYAKLHPMSKAAIWTPPEPIHHHELPCECELTIAYLRVSRVGTREEIISPDIQLSSIYENCIKSNKRVVKIVSDIDTSGRTFTARSVGSVIQDIADGVAKSVSLWKRMTALRKFLIASVVNTTMPAVHTSAGIVTTRM